MKLTIQGQGDVTLTQRDFLAAGGEGSIYVKGSLAFKVYADPSRMIPVGKITELSGISNLAVVKPERVLLDSHGKAVGYTMKRVTDALPLGQVLTRAFRERNALDHSKMLHLVNDLQQVVQSVHNAGVLIVDLNEFNFLTTQRFDYLYAIDVDSYQTPHYPATAIMPSVRDWHTPVGDFNEGSDWFSFAVLAFQMFTGIHPYKGKHPRIKGMEARMKANISVFDPSVSVPKVVYPVDVIPPNYREWMRRVFQEGERSAPPTGAGTFVALVPVRAVVSGDALAIDDIYRDAPSGNVLVYAENAGTAVIVTGSKVLVNQRYAYGRVVGRDVAIGFTSRLNRPVLASLLVDELQMHDLMDGSTVQGLNVRAEQMVACNGTFYVRSGDRILEVVLSDMGQSVVAFSRVAANVHPHATSLFPGCAIQNLLGSVFVSVFPRAGATYQVRVPELDGLRILDGKHEGRVLMVLVAQQGRYDRLTFCFDESYQHYRISAVEDITPVGLNFVVLDNGIIVHLTEDEQLEISSVTSNKVRTVKSDALGGDMRLAKYRGRVAFIRGNTVSTMRMK